jgi:hypothetical protein
MLFNFRLGDREYSMDLSPELRVAIARHLITLHKEYCAALSIPLNISQKSAIYSMSRSAFLLAGIVNLSDSNGLFNVLTASSATPSVSPPQS